MSTLSELLTILALRGAQTGQPGLPGLGLGLGKYARGGRPAGRPGALSALGQPQQAPQQFVSPSLVQGSGGGQDDNVQAAVSPGEYIWDADTVSAVGDGNNEEGARRLDQLRERIRAKKRSAPASKIPPKTGALSQYMGAR